MAKRPVLRTKQNVAIQRKTSGVKKPGFVKKQVQDARQKLILKKRNKVVDARDVLAKMAKTQDARSKLNKLRQKHGGGVQTNGNIKVIGSNIVQKTDRNGKISLSTNKAKSNANVAAGIGAAIQKELGLITNAAKKPVLKRPAQARAQAPAVQTLFSDIDPATYNQMLARTYESSLYKWAKPSARPTASQLISSLEPRPRIAKSDGFQGWQNFPVISKTMRLPHGYIDLDAVVDDEEMPMAPIKQTISLQGPSRISNIHSRLDSSPVEPETHGILAHTKTKVVVPAGHRIVVSNLQPTVSQEDVKELFEDIGQLLAARLVRPGVAEVIYKNLKDAQKAVDTYHNRQLDGQPMKCLLVNKRPLSNPTALPLSKMDKQGLITKEVQSAAGASNKLVPDLSTIHKVLFQRK